jgi:hypothetical protein
LGGFGGRFAVRGREFWEISVDLKVARVIVFNYLAVVFNCRLCRFEIAIVRVVVCVELRSGMMVGARLGALARGCGGRWTDFVAAAGWELAASREFWRCFIFLTPAQRYHAWVEGAAVR